MTSTTAAVIADIVPPSAMLLRIFSMNGAPANIQRKLGRKVTQVARIAPSVAAVSADSAPGSR